MTEYIKELKTKLLKNKDKTTIEEKNNIDYVINKLDNIESITEDELDSIKKDII